MEQSKNSGDKILKVGIQLLQKPRNETRTDKRRLLDDRVLLQF